jgi:hypothetical protein
MRRMRRRDRRGGSVSLFKCGCVENTALCGWDRDSEGRRILVCSECSPSGDGKWHGIFPKVDADAAGYRPMADGPIHQQAPRGLGGRGGGVMKDQTKTVSTHVFRRVARRRERELQAFLDMKPAALEYRGFLVPDWARGARVESSGPFQHSVIVTSWRGH